MHFNHQILQLSPAGSRFAPATRLKPGQKPASVGADDPPNQASSLGCPRHPDFTQLGGLSATWPPVQQHAGRCGAAFSGTATLEVR